jgi:prepilin-type N-terminal cleavage/methylation domain-containing protein
MISKKYFALLKCRVTSVQLNILIHKSIRQTRGFTILELLAAIGVLTVLFSIASVNLFAMKSSFDRNNARQSFEYDLRQARSAALSSGVRIVITLAADQKSYTVGKDLLPYDTTNGNHDSILFTTVLPNNITLTFSGTGAEASKLIFTSRGFLSDIGGNRNTSQRTASLLFNGTSFATATIYPVGVCSFSS